MPFSEPFMKVLCHNMPGDASKGYGALSPLLEPEVELVVLDPLDTAHILLIDHESFVSSMQLRLRLGAW